MKTILLKAMLAVAGILRMHPADAQSNIWTWISGSSSSNVPATTITPGSRDSQAHWQDGSGNFWIFGGQDHAFNAYNDLWEYSSSGKQWIQIGGNTSSPNTPNARYGAVGMTDPQGNFWIFGGANGSNCYNDLWEYIPATQTWSHVSGSTAPNEQDVYSGSSTGPGARCYAAAATDGGGNIWLFGGQDVNFNDHNDLWEFSTASRQWVFVSGTKNATNTAGVYSGSSTAPGARFGHSLWIDANQNIWIYSGDGYDNTTGEGEVFLNDLWEYSSGKWIWKNGGKSGNIKGLYGTSGNPSPNNTPGGRYGANALIDASGLFWVFGGAGYDASGSFGDLNDLWSYNPANNQWTWINGSNAINQSPVFGIPGAAGSSQPGGLQNASAWLDPSGSIWIMGGGGPGNDDYNDLWKFSTVATLPLTMISFQGTSRGTENYLTWQTVGEMYTSSFIVERSMNGTTFRDIGSRTAVGTGCNSYSFADDDPSVLGNNFYRLRTLHTDGTINYSPIIALDNNFATKNTAYPNPATTGITIRSGTDALLNTTAKWYDADGRLIRQQLITNREQYVDLHRFSAGIYLLQLADGTTIRIIKD